MYVQARREKSDYGRITAQELELGSSGFCYATYIIHEL